MVLQSAETDQPAMLGHRQHAQFLLLTSLVDRLQAPIRGDHCGNRTHDSRDRYARAMIPEGGDERRPRKPADAGSLIHDRKVVLRPCN